MKHYIILFLTLLTLACGSPTGPEVRVEITGQLDSDGHGYAALIVSDVFPVVTCYIAPDEDDKTWSVIASSFLSGVCEVTQQEGQSSVEIYQSIPFWYFRVVAVY